MSSFDLPRRRHRVVVRPKERARRARGFAAAAAVLVLGGIAAMTARKVASDFTMPAFSAASSAAVVATVEGPEPIRSLAQAQADAVAGGADAKAEAITARFPSVAEVKVRRSWIEKRATLTLVVRRAVAPATRKAKAAGFLSDDGVVFAAPEGAFVLSTPPVEVGNASPAELKALARELPSLAAPNAFPSALEGLTYRSPEDGWEARLADGTSVLWGRLEWTKEKLSRLSEAVADARAKEPGAFSADLRWFEDGKVLLKPAALRPGAIK